MFQNKMIDDKLLPAFGSGIPENLYGFVIHLYQTIIDKPVASVIRKMALQFNSQYHIPHGWTFFPKTRFSDIF
jgi:hypothetical protein